MDDNGASSYRRFLKGDWDGMTEIVETYYDGLILFLNRYLGNETDAEDMAEETLLVLVNKKPAFHGKSLFKTWLYNIARNTAIKYMYKNSRTIPVSPEDLTGIRIEDEDVLSQCVRKEDAETLNKAMEHLPEDYRLVLQLKYVEEMPVKEIAAATGRTVHSINSLLKRARSALRNELLKEGFRYEKS